MVAVARILNGTLVIPQLDKRSFWHDTRYLDLCFIPNLWIQLIADSVSNLTPLSKIYFSQYIFRYFQRTSLYQNLTKRC